MFTGLLYNLIFITEIFEMIVFTPRKGSAEIQKWARNLSKNFSLEELKASSKTESK